MITLAFHHLRSDWLSRVIAWFSGHPYSHVALVSPCGGYVIEASGLADPPGVRRYTFADWASRHPGYELATIEHPNPDAVWAAACTQLGRGYDWMWWLGFVFRNRRLHDRNKWTCAELIAWAAEQGGRPLFQLDVLWHVKPSDLRMIAKPKE